MDPKVKLNNNKNNKLQFTLTGCNVSLANAIRRTILSDIPQVVFKTTPNDESKTIIHENTSNLNNELIKQRLSCIPIHINDYQSFPYDNYIMELNVHNNTDTMMTVTTEHFKIIDKTNINEKGEKGGATKIDTSSIFPKNDLTGDYIDFVRLKPTLSQDIPGENIHLTAGFSIGTAKEDGMFNVVSTCSYGCTVDEATRDQELEKLVQKWKDEGKDKTEIALEKKNWKLLEGARHTIINSFDFIVETVGVYTNREILNKSTQVLIKRLDDLDKLIEEDKVEIEKSNNTMNNCFDITLENEDYTIGKVIEYVLHVKFYETGILTFCGFSKVHPHNSSSIVRVAYKDVVDKSYVKGNLKVAVEEAKIFFNKVQKEFEKLE